MEKNFKKKLKLKSLPKESIPLVLDTKGIDSFVIEW